MLNFWEEKILCYFFLEYYVLVLFFVLGVFVVVLKDVFVFFGDVEVVLFDGGLFWEVVVVCVCCFDFCSVLWFVD